MTRQATDVLLNIEKQNLEILGYLKNQDMLIKTLMNRLVVIEQRYVQPSSLASSVPTTTPPHGVITPKIKEDQKPHSQLPGLKPGVVIKGQDNNKQIVKPLNQQESSNVDFPSYEPTQSLSQELSSSLEIETFPIGKRRDARYVEENGITVQQKVLYPDGKSVSAARVEIFTKMPNSENLILVQNKKTNATGKWTGQLPAGNYLIKVFKKGTSTTPNVDAQQSVVVPNSDDAVQLKPIQT